MPPGQVLGPDQAYQVPNVQAPTGPGHFVPQYGVSAVPQGAMPVYLTQSYIQRAEVGLAGQNQAQAVVGLPEPEAPGTEFPVAQGPDKVSKEQ